MEKNQSVATKHKDISPELQFFSNRLLENIPVLPYQ